MGYRIMRTLVIHPEDPTTDFLTKVYDGLPDTTVMRRGASSYEVTENIKAHERTIMLGHGTPAGLLAVGKFGASMFAVHVAQVAELKNQPENIYMWCNADQFVQQWGLRSAFYTGMFISEVAEARMLDIKTTQGRVDESNRITAEALNLALLSGVVARREVITTMDSHITCNNIEWPDTEIMDYNMQRMYQR